MTRALLLSTVTAAVIVATVGLPACQKKSSEPPPLAPPTEGLVTAMRDYCSIGNMPPDKQDDARKLWGWQTAGDKDVGPMWNAAVVKKDKAAIATIWAAAEQAVGKGNCPDLDPIGR